MLRPDALLLSTPEGASPMSSWALPHPILSPSLCLLAARSVQENLNHTYEVTPALPTLSLHIQPLLGPKQSIYLTMTVSIFRFQSHLNQRGEKVKRKKKQKWDHLAIKTSKPPSWPCFPGEGIPMCTINQARNMSHPYPHLLFSARWSPGSLSSIFP